MNYYNTALQKIKCAQQQFSTASCCCINPNNTTPTTITVGTTTTGLPGTEASVTNSGTSTNVVLDFVIPAGEPGQNASGLEAFGGLAINSPEQVTLSPADTAVEVPLTTVLPNQNINASANNITITEPGIYEIDYNLNVTSTAEITNLTFAVRNNEINIPETVISQNITANSTTTYSGSTIVLLDEGNTIDLALTDSAGTGTVTVNNANLIVKKLNNTTT